MRKIYVIITVFTLFYIIICNSYCETITEYILRGEDYYKKGKFDEAISDYNKALEIRSTE